MWLFIGMATAKLARQKGREPTTWFFWGVLFGLFTYVCLWFLPSVLPKKKEKEQEACPAVASPPIVAKAVTAEQQWYFIDQTQNQKGPFLLKELQYHWQGKEITSSSLVWTEGLPQWQQIECLPYLQELLASPV